MLRAETFEVSDNTPGLQQFIDDMVETMRGASGVGLAAPQVGRCERLFVADLSPVADGIVAERPESLSQPLVFINPEILEEGEEETEFEEGCLSIPDLYETVVRADHLRMKYLDGQFEPQIIEVRGKAAGVLQHEYDHLEGILFIDYLSSFGRSLLKRRLRNVSLGIVEADYPLRVASSV